MRKLLLLVVCGLAIAACGDDGDGDGNGIGGEGGQGGVACPATGLGTVEVTVEGLPAGVDAEVRVGGRIVTASETFEWQGGPLHVDAEPVALPDDLVRPLYRPTVEPEDLCVADGESSTVDVVYDLVPTSALLWATTKNEASGAIALDRDELGGAPLGDPAVSANAGASTGGQAPVDLAFDPNGDLWFAYAVNELQRYSAAAIAAGGDPDPDVVLGGAGLGVGLPGPVALAFDPDGNLWVTLAADDRVVRFRPEQLEQSGSPTPDVAIGGAGSAIDAPGAIAFDAAGNLFVAFDGKLGRYDASRLGASTTEAPDRVIEASLPDGGGTLGAPAGLAFDADGNLWATFFGPNVVARIDAADLAGTGEATVEPEIQLVVGLSALLGGLAFDESGGLWVALGPPGVGRYAPEQLEAGGDVSPSLVIGGTNLTRLAFFPAASGLPLHSAVP